MEPGNIHIKDKTLLSAIPVRNPSPAFPGAGDGTTITVIANSIPIDVDEVIHAALFPDGSPAPPDGLRQRS